MLQELLETAGYTTQDYSGRFMFGKRCVAIVTDDNLAEITINVLNVCEVDELPTIKNKLRYVKSDDMGRSTVYYWPSEEYTY